MKQQILFVTYQSEAFDEGLSYAIDLARTMNKDLTILMAHNRNFFKKLEDIMTAITFAEAGEPETSKEIFSGKIDTESEGKLNTLMEKCQDAGVTTRVYTVALDALSAIKDFLKQQAKVDMVLLSPSITNNGSVTSGDLQKLVKTESRPIVTMSRHVYAA